MYYSNTHSGATQVRILGDVCLTGSITGSIGGNYPPSTLIGLGFTLPGVIDLIPETVTTIPAPTGGYLKGRADIIN